MRTLFRPLLPVLILLWGSPSALAQTYYNNRYPLTTIYSGATTLLANGTGVIVAAGASRGAGQELTLTFLDSAGRLQRTRFYQHRAGNALYSGVRSSLLRLGDGGLALVGNGEDATGTSRGILWRFNAQGDTLWTRTYAGVYWLVTRSGCLLPDGGFLLVGADQVVATGGTDVLVIRTDSLGREQWRRTVNINRFEDLQYALPTPDGGYLVTGYTQLRSGGGPTDNDWLVFKLDSVGNIQWQRILGQPNFNEGAGAALLTPDGGYLATGGLGDRLIGTSLTSSRAALTKFDAAGTIVWQRRYGPSRWGTGAVILHALPDGGYVLAGGVSDPTTGSPGPGQAFVLKVCANGDSVWYRTHELLPGPQSYNYIRDLVLTADGGFAGCGFIHPRPPDTGTQDVWVFKTDANGYLLPGGAPPTVQCPPLGVGLAEPEAAGGAAVSVWPNPAVDGRFTVGASPPAPLLKERGAYVVVDALGRRVAAGELSGAETVVDLGRCAPGVYLLRLTWPEGRTITKKLLR